MNPIFNLLGQIVAPVTKLVDELHTSEDEKLKARAALVEIQLRAGEQLLAYEGKLMDAKAGIIRAEAQGQSWLQRSWRPITMLTFLGLVVADAMGLLAFRLAGEAWSLLQIGLGGYVVGRSAEKIAPTITAAMRKD
ncbi:holin family protein [Flagellatimonas centrodinii]|uniref:3TM-type holin n=1 Tax=Flagellatimonas centrodinii TaxID=2806210 RepID=UPI001FEFFAB5|nr:3TM-type holin [Flagellatimonas centrodinii]ULQ45886.1 holin family protein [Flagellatimonas centrodinii]